MADTPLKSGARLYSQVCGTSVIVIRPGSARVDLRCGGAPMAPSAAGAPGAGPRSPFDQGSPLGKRYTHPADASLELLVSSPGEGSLSDGDTLLVLKEAKPLPASD